MRQYESIKHPFGSCYIRATKDAELYGYVHIPKNASCFGKAFWEGGIEKNFIRDDLTRVKEWAVILRDPLRRWISGVSQALYTRPNLDDAVDWNEIFDQVVLDNHTTPQVEFIRGLDMSKIVWFRSEDPLEDNLLRYLDDKLPLVRELHNDYDADVYNFSTFIPAKVRVAEVIKTRMALDPSLKQRIIDFYKEDYDLYNSVRYFNK